MKLKEFGLHLPKGPQEQRNAFRLQTRCMCALYERCFPGLNVDGGWKVEIECVEQVERPEVRNLLGVFTRQLEFNHRTFLEASPLGRKKMAVAALHLGVTRVAEAQGWPLEPFNTAHAGVLERSFVNQWAWPAKPQLSPGKKHQAVLRCAHEPDSFRAWLVVEDRSGKELKRTPILDEAPSEFQFVPKMGKLTWRSANQVVLVAKDGTEVGDLSLVSISE